MRKTIPRVGFVFLSLFTLSACDSNLPEAEKATATLGRYEMQLGLEAPSKPTGSSAIREYLGWPESIGAGNPVASGFYAASAVSCTPGVYDISTRKLTASTRIRNLLSPSIPECAVPGSPDYLSYCACASSHPLFSMCGKRLRGPLELKVYGFYAIDVRDKVSGISQGPLLRTDLIGLNADYGCWWEGCTYNDASFPGYDLNATEYKTLHPAWDFGPAANAAISLPDLALDAGEETACLPIVFEFSDASGRLTTALPNNVPVFHLAFDLLGFIEGQGTLPSPPVVGTTPRSTNALLAQIPVTIQSPANRVRISTGTSETECLDNAACDKDPRVNEVRASLFLQPNRDNRIYVHQSNGATQSPAVLRMIRQIPPPSRPGHTQDIEAF